MSWSQDVVPYIFQVVEQVVGGKSLPPVPLLVICSDELEKNFTIWIQIRQG